MASASGKIRPVVNFPEIVFGLVGALGSDISHVKAIIRNCLARKIKPKDPRLAIQEIKIIDAVNLKTLRVEKDEIERDINDESLINGMPGELENRLRRAIERCPDIAQLEDAGVRRYINMLAGDICRRKIAAKLKGFGDHEADNSAMAFLAILRMQNSRERILNQRGKDNEPYAMNTVYLLHSLKHPDEVKALRAIYGGAFVLVGIYKDEDERRNNLCLEMGEDYDESTVDEVVDYFMKKDQKDSLKEYGQNVRDTFPMSDLFVNGSGKDSQIRDQIDRFVELLFSDPRHTPTKDESAMFHAYASSLRSSAPGRQVGAAIINNQGEILSLGMNEVAKPGGGHYWFGDITDRRAIKDSHDPNTREKQRITEDLFNKLKGVLKDGVELEEFAKAAVKSKIADITEFDRTVHAESSALALASRNGVSVQDGILYCTTFPCHLCAKMIIAAGIKKIVYVEPYPKSKAPDLYPEAFGKEPSAHFSVTPFVGVGARLFFDLFSVFTSFGREIPRKDREGNVIDTPEIRFRLPTRALSHSEMEVLYLERVRETLSEDGNSQTVEQAR